MTAATYVMGVANRRRHPEPVKHEHHHREITADEMFNEIIATLQESLEIIKKRHHLHKRRHDEDE